MVGIIKEVDRLGRMVIPKEYRERYGLSETVEIIATEAGILIRNPEYVLTKVHSDDNSEQPLNKS